DRGVDDGPDRTVPPEGADAPVRAAEPAVAAPGLEVADRRVQPYEVDEYGAPRREPRPECDGDRQGPAPMLRRRPERADDGNHGDVDEERLHAEFDPRPDSEPQNHRRGPLVDARLSDERQGRQRPANKYGHDGDDHVDMLFRPLWGVNRRSARLEVVLHR